MHELVGDTRIDLPTDFRRPNVIRSSTKPSINFQPSKIHQTSSIHSSAPILPSHIEKPGISSLCWCFSAVPSRFCRPVAVPATFDFAEPPHSLKYSIYRRFLRLGCFAVFLLLFGEDLAISRPILRRFQRALRGQDRLVVSVIVVRPACRYVPPFARYGSFFVECWISGCWFGPLWSCCCSVVRVCRF